MSFAGPRPHFSPLETSSSSTTPLAPRLTVTMPSGSCAADGMKTPTQLAQRRLDLGPVHDLPDVRRADLLLALGDQHEVDRQLLAGAADRVQRGEERRLGSLLVHRAAADDHLAEARLVDDARLERRRRPLGRIELLDVVHEVEADRLRRRRRRASRTRPACRRSGRSSPSGSRRRARAAPCAPRPAAEFRFSAAIDGSAIQSCSRFTASSCRAAISRWTSAKSSAARAVFSPVVVSVVRISKARTCLMLLSFSG